MELIIQIIGVGGILMNLISFQCNSHKKIMFYRCLNECLFAVQYYLLHAYLGTMTNLLVCLRNYRFASKVQKDQSTGKDIVIFSILFIFIGIANWQGLTSIVMIVVKVLSTIAYGNKNPRVLRGMTLFTSSGWLIFNLTVGSYAGIMCEVLSLTSIILGIWRFDLAPLLQMKLKKE